MTIKIIVADDEALARNELIYLLEKSQDIEVIGEAATGEEALKLIKQRDPDAVFLDIQMPKLDGLEVALELTRGDKCPIIVFATAYDRHAIKAFEINAIDYLLKPFEEERVKLTIERIREGISRSKEYNLSKTISDLIQKEIGKPKSRVNKIAVQEEDRVFFLDPDEIVYIYREGRDVFIITDKHKYTSKYSLQSLEDKLKDYHFLRTHRAYLVNINRIEQMVPWFNGAFTLIMKDQNHSEVPVSRMFLKELKDTLGFI